MEYNAALDRLFGLTDYERLSRAGSSQPRTDLGRMEAFLARLGNPHHAVPAVHVAGTKGKGSVAAMCMSVLRAQGYHVGFYTSPHLHTFRERIQVNGHPISEGEFADLVGRIWPHVEEFNANGEYGQVTLFEVLTAMAFWHFQQQHLDFQVVEVGLGGRLDATNVVNGVVSVITSLSLDHTAILGDTLEQIAAEKAGIIKDGAAVVSAPQRTEAMRVIQRVCKARNARLVRVDRSMAWRLKDASLDGQSLRVDGRLGSYDVRIPLIGGYQLENAATAIAAIEVLKERGVEISDRALEKGLASVEWPCRMEVLQRQPLIIADGAHNPYSASRLREAVKEYVHPNRTFLIFGASGGKHYDEMAAELAPICSQVMTTRSRHPRSVSSSDLADVFRRLGLSTVETVDVRDAVTQAVAMVGEDDLVLITGSLFVAAEAREYVKGIKGEVYPEMQSSLLVP